MVLRTFTGLEGLLEEEENGVHVQTGVLGTCWQWHSVGGIQSGGEEALRRTEILSRWPVESAISMDANYDYA